MMRRASSSASCLLTRNLPYPAPVYSYSSFLLLGTPMTSSRGFMIDQADDSSSTNNRSGRRDSLADKQLQRKTEGTLEDEEGDDEGFPILGRTVEKQEVSRYHKERSKLEQEMGIQEGSDESILSQSNAHSLNRGFGGNNQVDDTALSFYNPDGDTAGISAMYRERAMKKVQRERRHMSNEDKPWFYMKPLNGKASIDETKFTIDRSTVFDEWHHQCSEPVGWYMSKLGTTFSKAGKFHTDAVDATQLQIIKGMNVFDIDVPLAPEHCAVFQGITEAIEAFELNRSGFIFIAHGGAEKYPTFDKTKGELGQIRQKQQVRAYEQEFKEAAEMQAEDLAPSLVYQEAFNFSTMTDLELQQHDAVREPLAWDQMFTTVVKLSRVHLETVFEKLAAYARIETVDVFMLDGVGLLFQGQEVHGLTETQVAAKLLECFTFLEEMVAKGCIQYYGISSDQLCPDDPKKSYLPVPENAQCPDRFKRSYQPKQCINLYRVMALAEEAAAKVHGDSNKSHHMRFLQYTFNFTQRTANSEPLPYDSNHTLTSLAKALNLTCLTKSPLETRDNQDMPQRYTRHVMVPNLHMARLQYTEYFQKALSKEKDIRQLVESRENLRTLAQDLLVGNKFALQQRVFGNYYHFDKWLTEEALPLMRQRLYQWRRRTDSDARQWSKDYEQLVYDFARYRRSLLEHNHAKKSIEQEQLVDKASLTLAKCPIFSQKALNFALTGGDVTCSGMYKVRYFQEATDLNPMKGEILGEEEVKKLTAIDDLSFTNQNRIHPYVFEVPSSPQQGRFSLQKSPSAGFLGPVNVQRGEWPDIPKSIHEGKREQKAKISAKLTQALPAGSSLEHLPDTQLATLTDGSRPAPPPEPAVRPQHLTTVDPVTGKLKLAGQSELTMRAVKNPALLAKEEPLQDTQPLSTDTGGNKSRFIMPSLPLGTHPTKQQLEDEDFDPYMTKSHDKKISRGGRVEHKGALIAEGTHGFYTPTKKPGRR